MGTKKLKLHSEIQAIAPDRYNLVAVVPGTDPGKSLLLNGHLDTVGVSGMENPFTLKQKDDRLFGRGAYDMKGSLAVMLLLAEYFTLHPPPFDILLTFVADEEDKSLGMDYLVENWLPDISPPPIGAIFLDNGLDAARKFVVDHFGGEIERLDRDSHKMDYKSILQEITQSRFQMLPKYSVMRESGQPHDRTYEVSLSIAGERYGFGKGRSKKEAQQEAAREALRKLQA